MALDFEGVWCKRSNWCLVQSQESSLKWEQILLWFSIPNAPCMVYIFLTLAHQKNYSNVSTCRKKTYAIWAIHDAFWHVFSPVEDVDVFLNVSPEAVTLYPGYSGPTVLLNLPCRPWGVCDTWGGPNIIFPLKVGLDPTKLVLMKFKWVIEIDLQ